MSKQEHVTQMIFVVTSGSYSEYSIDAVCSTEEKAQATIDSAKAADEYWASDARIEEWPLDEGLQKTKLTYWTTEIILEDGTIAKGNPGPHVRWEKPFRGRVLDITWDHFRKQTELRVESTVSLEHAQKLASEARQAWLRTKGDIATIAAEIEGLNL